MKRTKGLLKSTKTKTLGIIAVFAISFLYLSVVEAQTIKPSIDIFADYTYDMTNGKQDLNSFNVKRAYLGVKGSLTKEDAEGMKVNYRLTLDVVDFSDIGAKGSYEVKNVDGKDQVEVMSAGTNGLYMSFLKYAYLELEDMGLKGLKLQFGQIPTPWVSFEDKFVGMRWWSPSFTDRAKVLSSADRGLSLSYNLPAKYGEVFVSAVNGEGYKKPEDTKMKDYLARISIRPVPDMDIVKGLMLHYYIGYGKTNVDKTNPDAESVRQRMSIGLSFDHDYFLLLGQYLLTEDGPDSKTTKGAGYSASSRIKLEKLLESNQLGLFFRYDRYDPNTDKDKDGKDIIIVGPYYYFIDNKAAIGLNYTKEMFEDTEKYKDISQVIFQALISY